MDSIYKFEDCTNKGMELVSAAVKVASTEDHGITHVQVPETIVPSFGQAKLLLSAGLGFEMVSSDGSTITDLGTTVKAPQFHNWRVLHVN